MMTIIVIRGLGGDRVNWKRGIETKPENFKLYLVLALVSFPALGINDLDLLAGPHKILASYSPLTLMHAQEIEYRARACRDCAVHTWYDCVDNLVSS